MLPDTTTVSEFKLTPQDEETIKMVGDVVREENTRRMKEWCDAEDRKAALRAVLAIVLIVLYFVTGTHQILFPGH